MSKTHERAEEIMKGQEKEIYFKKVRYYEDIKDGYGAGRPEKDSKQRR